MAHLLGIDLGTSAVKVVLYNDQLRPICSAGRSYPLSSPKNGWAEQNPDDWSQAAFACIRETIDQSGVQPESIAAVGLSGQMNGVALLDKDGRPLRPAILWFDQRGAAECEEINARLGAEKLFAITCNPALTGFSLAKLLWVKNNQPEVFAACRHIMLPKDYIRLRLTGEYATDMSDASGMQLLDTPHRCWSREITAALGLDDAILPAVYESPEITGRVTRRAAEQTGLREGTPVVAGAGDNAAAAVGSGVADDCRAFLSLGTSGVISAHAAKLRVDGAGRVHTFCGAVPGEWLVVASEQSAGLSMQWMRDTLYPDDREYEQINRDIASLPVGARRLIYLPYLMGDRSPHMNPDARGVFFGLSSIHTRGDMARAVMEGVSYGIRDCLGVLNEMGIAPEEMLLCGGGAKSAVWRQMLADVLGLPMRRLENADSGALGASVLAGVGAGVFGSVRDVRALVCRPGSADVPNTARSAEYDRYYALFRALYPHLQGDFKTLSGL